MTPETLDPAAARHAAIAGASPSELIAQIRTRLGPTSARRVGTAHATVLNALIAVDQEFLDVNALYKALLDQGSPMVMSKVYRVLKVLEEARVIERHWAQHEGRPRSVYRVAGRSRDEEGPGDPPRA